MQFALANTSTTRKRVVPGRFEFLVVLLFLAATQVSFAQQVDFQRDVLPILEKHCASCHNAEDAESDFDATSVNSILKGSSHGPGVAKGDAPASHIIQLIRGTEDPAMPPIDDYERVPEKDIAVIEKWINQGARESKIKSNLLKIDAPDWKPATATAAAILAADWSDDGKFIAAAEYGKVQLLDAQTLKPIHVFDGLPGKVNSVQFSNAGESLVVGTGIAGVGGRAIVFDIDTRKEVLRIDGHKDVLYDAVVSPDGKRIATASYGKTIVIYDGHTGDELRRLTGHNSAIYDLHFSADSQNLVSASGDQTIKIWNVETGERLDTLGQPLKEQFVATVSPAGDLVVGGGRDSRLRVWKFVTKDKIGINPILFSRFAHEGSIVRLKFSADGSRLFSSAEDREIKVWETETWTQVGALKGQPEIASALAVSPDGQSLFLGRLDGSAEVVSVPAPKKSVNSVVAIETRESWAAEAAKLHQAKEAEANDKMTSAMKLILPTEVAGSIAAGDDVDTFRFTATQGKAMIIETRAAADSSPLDTHIAILDEEGKPVPQVVLRAVRDSWFTFRGKDSDTMDDFRLHNWQEMNLNEYLYANGEVTRLFLHPRGPDSGFRVYPGVGKRHTFFGTTPISHALQEPCYIVQPFPPGTSFIPNGLPLFELNYENDDDPNRVLGKDSWIKFVPPKDGDYFVRVRDVRGFGGKDHKYRLIVRDSHPDFKLKIDSPKKIYRGGGQEFAVKANRIDGFAGPITVNVNNVPEGFRIESPLVVEQGQMEAFATIHATEGAASITKERAGKIEFVATAEISGTTVEHKFAGFAEVQLEDKDPKVKLYIVAGEQDSVPEKIDFDNPLKLEIRPGESIMAWVICERSGHEGRVTLGKEGAGRNLPFGVYVDDIGLSGLMIPKRQNRQRFFIKAEDLVEPQTRTFHLHADELGKVTSIPAVITVLPRKGSPN